MNRTWIKGATIVNEGTTYVGSLLIEGAYIKEVKAGSQIAMLDTDIVIDAQGYLLMPGVIDDHVHFRDPGLTHKADMTSETEAAVAGGVTSFMDMPNCVPQTTTLEALEEKHAMAREKSLINYSFYLGATNNNVHLLRDLDTSKVCGVKLFMGASTGNMLVDRKEALRKIFEESPILIATHCEDQGVIRIQTEHYKQLYGEDAPIEYHPYIRNEEACFNSSQLAVELARETGARLHVLHLTTARELSLFIDKPIAEKHITAEVCIPHLMYTEEDYRTLGSKIKCNPAIKTQKDREQLRKALHTNLIDVVATDHAPHLLAEKEGGAFKATSGMPYIQFSLLSMLELVEQQIIDLPTVVQKMCHAPAEIYQIDKRGYLREGYYADLVLVDRTKPCTITKEDIRSKCGWSPAEGKIFPASVHATFVNGKLVYNKGKILHRDAAQPLLFHR